MATLFGLAGLDEEARDAGRGVLLADLEPAARFEELGVVFFLLALFAGVLTFESCSLPPTVKLNSLIGDTLDLLLLFGAFFEVDFAPLGLDLDFDAEAGCFFLMEAGVVLALDDLGLGVPLTGFDARFAGVGVCLAILNDCCFC